eukprot:TRINITY_DN10206_c0_g1_i2.p1 TRINITY_DN10206_c0_g1~~TRINITY_DN10206_c0_g1_i2.p1  ORF type:complete len:193 (+),score=9.21 TRINITY_DN10206_c0_g1_i2:57-635(+)
MDVEKNPLWVTWVLHYDGPVRGRQTSKNWSDNVKEVANFDTVQDFWSIFNNICPPMQLAPGSNYHLFKAGIKPMWEDEANRRGGKWIASFPIKHKSLMDSCWLHLCMALIGEQFVHSDEVTGAVASVRKANNRISLWTRNSQDRDTAMQIGQQFRTLLSLDDVPEIKLIFQAHADALQNDSSYGNKTLYCLD